MSYVILKLNFLLKKEFFCRISIRLDTPKHKIHRTQQAQSGPEVIRFERFAHIEDGEWDENTESDHFLGDFELTQ